MIKPRRRFEVLLPLRFQDGSPVPDDLLAKSRREVEYEFGAITVESQRLLGYDRHSGEQRDLLLRLNVDVADTPENLAFFYKFKQELKARFQQEEIRVVTFVVGVL